MFPKLYLKLKNQDEVDVSKAIRGLFFLGDDEAPAFLATYQSNVGQDGQLLQTLGYDKNTINAKFFLQFGKYYDYKLAKHEVYKLFGQRETMRIRTDAEPAIVKYVVPATFDLAPLTEGEQDTAFTIPFDNPSGYKYSLVRSDEIKTVDNGLQFGMGLPADTDVSYTHAEKLFRIFNASDITIDPYYQLHDLILKINFEGDKLTITNKTTNTSWSYLKAAKMTDNIVLDGIKTTLNGEPASINTDYGNLTLASGWNDIVVTDATTSNITFSFPFIYIG